MIRATKLPQTRWTPEESMARTFDMFYQEGSCLEIRAFCEGKILFGFFDDKAAFVDKAKVLSEYCEGVFVTENPVINDYLSLYPKNLIQAPYYIKNRYPGIDLEQKGKVSLTPDTDIAIESAIVVDVDPKRHSGISSNDKELEAAMEVAYKISHYIDCRDKSCYLGFSGNGYHLVIPMVPHPVTDKTTLQRKAFLKLLSDKFSTDEVEVDEAVFNLARIIKLYGTMARKGVNNTENGRVHRCSWIDQNSGIHRNPDFYADFNLVLEEKPQQTTIPQQFRSKGVIDVAAMLDCARIIYRKKEEGKWELLECQCDNSGHKPYESIVTQAANGGMAYFCHHNRCKKFLWKEFSNHLKFNLRTNPEDFRK